MGRRSASRAHIKSDALSYGGTGPSSSSCHSIPLRSSERDAARVMHAIISVLDYCHSMGVCHRDLKPENFLFLDEREEAPLKAIDFGLSIFFKTGERSLWAAFNTA